LILLGTGLAGEAATPAKRQAPTALVASLCRDAKRPPTRIAVAGRLVCTRLFRAAVDGTGLFAREALRLGRLRNCHRIMHVAVDPGRFQ
jgi:hypothetical protein